MPNLFTPYINTLVVADGIFKFGAVDESEATFTLQFLIDTLRSTRTGVRFRVTTAHRRADSNADQPGFIFSDRILNDFDVLWLFGYEGANVGLHNLTDSILDDEIAAIGRFMNAGGGVFAAGDHDGLGSVLCGKIPRVRSMRKWYSEIETPTDYPPNAPGTGSGRLDTTRADYNNEFWFDNQSDDIPQVLTPLESHPVLQSSRGLIVKFPDHMHEGEVTVPWNLHETLTFSGESFQEYPEALFANRGGVVHPTPRIIATGSTLGNHSTMTEGHDKPTFQPDPTLNVARTFNAICVYDGSRVNVGRVLTQSSFHHFLDLNLTGDSLGVGNKTLGFTTPAGLPVLDGLQQYFRNVGWWLAETRHYFFNLILSILELPWWVKLFNPGGPVEENPLLILEYGKLMRQALARYGNGDLSVEFIRSTLLGTGLEDLIPAEAWRASIRSQPADRVSARLVEAALGGAAMALMQMQAAEPSRRAPFHDVQERTLAGIRTGVRSLGHAFGAEAAEAAALSSRLREIGLIQTGTPLR